MGLHVTVEQIVYMYVRCKNALWKWTFLGNTNKELSYHTIFHLCMEILLWHNANAACAGSRGTGKLLITIRLTTKTSSTPHYWSFAAGRHRLIPHKGPVMHKSFPCCDFVMFCRCSWVGWTNKWLFLFRKASCIMNYCFATAVGDENVWRKDPVCLICIPQFKTYCGIWCENWNILVQLFHHSKNNLKQYWTTLFDHLELIEHIFNHI